jgi:hypothetical protein
MIHPVIADDLKQANVIEASPQDFLVINLILELRSGFNTEEVKLILYFVCVHI